MPHCVIHTLDCTLQIRVPPALQDKVHPHQICLGEKTETLHGRQFMTWGAFVAHIQLKAPPVALKMDIEGTDLLCIENTPRRLQRDDILH